METMKEVVRIVGDVLQLGDRADTMTVDTRLIGYVPEFDSMAVVSVITALEESYGFVVEDDEIEAATFETVGSLVTFVRDKLPK